MGLAMDLNERMMLLRESDLLSDKNYRNMLSIMKMFKDRYGICLTEENGAAFVTHACVALERIDKNEKTEPLDRALVEEAKTESTYPKAVEICGAIHEMLPQIPEMEMEYLCVHIGVMLQEMEEAAE
jgi:transcriptional regulatory protein LevR